MYVIEKSNLKKNGPLEIFGNILPNGWGILDDV